MSDEVSDEILERYYHADLATLWTAVRHSFNGPLMMEGVQSFEPGVRMVGRARTLRWKEKIAQIADDMLLFVANFDKVRPRRNDIDQRSLLVGRHQPGSRQRVDVSDGASQVVERQGAIDDDRARELGSQRIRLGGEPAAPHAHGPRSTSSSGV